MFVHLILVASVFLSSSLLVNSASAPKTEPIPFLLWAATDPTEDGEIAKVNVTKFIVFVENHLQELNEIYEKNDVIGGSFLLSSNAEESGTKGVTWPAVFAKFALKKTLGKNEDNEHGLPSLVSWAVRKTGPGTTYPSVNSDQLTVFILEHKNIFIKYLNAGDLKGLINYLDESSTESGTVDVNWKTVINNLKDNKQLFMYPCGFLNLQLCDRLKK